MDADDTHTGESSEEDESQAGGTGTESSEGSASADTGAEESQSGDEIAELRAKLAAANREAAKFRKERNAAKSEIDKLREADLSETEREKKRADEAERKLQESMTRVQQANLAVAISQSGKNIVDVETASMLLTNQGIEFDDEGKPEGIEEALDRLVKAKPFLASGRSAPIRDTNGGAGSDESDTGGVHLSADELMVARAFKMTPEDYAKYKTAK